jgi:hypothetical protein
MSTLFVSKFFLRVRSTRYVDDILIIYNHHKHIEEQIAQDLETIHKNIEFT